MTEIPSYTPTPEAIEKKSITPENAQERALAQAIDGYIAPIEQDERIQTILGACVAGEVLEVDGTTRENLRTCLEERLPLLKCFNGFVFGMRLNRTGEPVDPQVLSMKRILPARGNNNQSRFLNWSGEGSEKNPEVELPTGQQQLSSSEYIVELALMKLLGEFDEERTELMYGSALRNPHNEVFIQIETGLHRAAADLLLGRNPLPKVTIDKY